MRTVTYGAACSADNRVDGVAATLAHIFVGSGVVRRRIVGPGTVVDSGGRKIIER